MYLKSINPKDGTLIAEYKELNPEQIDIAIHKSAIASDSWRKVSFESKALRMKNLVRTLVKQKEELAKAITKEMGKPIVESIAEIEKCAWVCEYYAENAKTFLKTELIQTEAFFSRVDYEPLGVIFGVMPWNFPFWQAFRFLAPTLMAGNVVLIKHASNVQGCAERIQSLFVESGFPEGVVNNLTISAAKVKRVIENQVIKAVTLTGSEKAGSAVGELAGRNIKKTVMELGGSNAFIVLDDADINRAVEVGVNARMMNGGQSCIAAKRFIIHEAVATEFIRKYVERVKGLVVGDPGEKDTDVGPLSSIIQSKEVEYQVNKSINMGAELLIGGKRQEAFYLPTVLVNVNESMPVMKEEVFGPVSPMAVVKNDSEAIELANKTNFGLGVSIMTGDIERAEEMIPLFDDGAVFINSLVKSDPRLPFGGTKKSGYGRELSIHGIKEFVNAKTVYVNNGL